MKKQSNLSRLMGYAGGHKILTYLSWPAGEPRDRISERPAGDQLRFQRADPAVRNNLGQLSGDQAAGAVFE